MGAADGRVVGTTRIVDSGDPAERWNLVIVAEGYRESELPQFERDAQSFVDTLAATPPFDELMRGINVFRVDVASTDSGADDPTPCGGSGATPATFFDASFCTNGIQRLLVVANLALFNVLNAEVPAWHMALVIVNSPVYGGSGGQVAVFSLAAGANEIALHEMGHTAFGLADEYESYAGCGIDTDRDHHPVFEPAEPNVTIDPNRATIKWGALIDAATPLPTTANPDCRLCDPQPSPVPPGTVGAFEGAHYYHCGAYRPAFDCRMRALGQPFCPVCQQRIRDTIGPFLPPPEPEDPGCEEPGDEPAYGAL
jgi:IgA peptidase M64